MTSVSHCRWPAHGGDGRGIALMGISRKLSSAEISNANQSCVSHDLPSSSSQTHTQSPHQPFCSLSVHSCSSVLGCRTRIQRVHVLTHGPREGTQRCSAERVWSKECLLLWSQEGPGLLQTFPTKAQTVWASMCSGPRATAQKN